MLAFTKHYSICLCADIFLPNIHYSLEYSSHTHLLKSNMNHGYKISDNFVLKFSAMFHLNMPKVNRLKFKRLSLFEYVEALSWVNFLHGHILCILSSQVFYSAYITWIRKIQCAATYFISLSLIAWFRSIRWPLTVS